MLVHVLSLPNVAKGLCLFRAIKDHGNPDDALEAFILTVKSEYITSSIGLMISTNILTDASDGQLPDALFELGPRRLVALLNRAPPVSKALREVNTICRNMILGA